MAQRPVALRQQPQKRRIAGLANSADKTAAIHPHTHRPIKSPSAQVIWCDFPRRYHNTRPNREGRVPCRRETARIGAAAQAVGALPRKPDPGRCLCHRSGLGQPADKRALPRRTPPIMARTHRYRHE
jgi:hypothetical protein